ncbi:MAG: hypothetical protein ABIK45_07385 [Pseudomonadota bacterium]
MARKVDVLINVCGKPLQTTLALLSLERACGEHIDTIYFTEESTTRTELNVPTIDDANFEYISNRLESRVVYHRPTQWNYCFALEPDRLDDRDYRHSIRYQYGWEMTDKDHILIIHNDTYFRSDVIGAMLDEIGDHAAIGHIGQCWYCPAAFTGRCDSDRYLEFRPDFEELFRLYKTTTPPKGSMLRAYHMPTIDPMFIRQPWPLPECRVNEWCALINMEKARKLTAPHGRITPFGAIVGVGAQILDVGCQWFREMNIRGHACKHFDIYRHMHHDVPPTGQPTLIDKGRYKDKELAALETLRREFDFPS